MQLATKRSAGSIGRWEPTKCRMHFVGEEEGELYYQVQHFREIKEFIQSPTW